MIFLLVLSILINALSVSFIIWKIYDVEKNDAKITRWLFDSLYSLNSNVKLPDDESKISTAKAEVYNPATDPMNEFDGRRDDFHS